MTAELCDRLSFEHELWQRGFQVVAGVDEAGRGRWPDRSRRLADHPNVKFEYYRKGLGTCAAEMH